MERAKLLQYLLLLVAEVQSRSGSSNSSSMEEFSFMKLNEYHQTISVLTTAEA
jgi:hypothetical protein